MEKNFKFAFLLIKEHPMGRVMIYDLIQAGFIPGLIVEEDTEGGVVRRKYYEDIMEKVPPTVAALAAEYSMPRLDVRNHNGDECRYALKECKPNLMALGNCNIIRPYIYEIAGDGCINTHPGLLPLVRGVYPVVWAIYHDHPSGCCTHMVDATLDTGPILYNQKFPVYRGESIENLLEKACYLAGRLIVRAFRDYCGEGLRPVLQKPGQGNYYSKPSERVFAVAAQKLKEGTYKHYAD